MAEGVKNSMYPDQLFLGNIDGDGYTIPENGKISIKKIIEFLHEIKAFPDRFAALSYTLSEIAVYLGIGFYTYILEVTLFIVFVLFTCI